jgi:hypothetical protein
MNYCLFLAAFVSLRSIIMVELMGIEKLSNSFGLVVLCQGMSAFIGPPITGNVRQQPFSYLGGGGPGIFLKKIF